ncbi:hypothetical protein E2C01_017816 [Portunus trituberculatus]|uniref:Uncharacterized protein n=1 Tax=Portunus trituberculatus TaxID=210409 RepID=A0A5B7DUU2_PORTR|nr:hypothetical protein [Portunus trituberculatus]
MRAWTIPLAVAVMVCSLMCLVKGTTAAPRISSQQLWDMAVAGEDEDYKEGRKWGDKDEDGNDKEDTNEENKKREERNVNQPQNGVLARHHAHLLSSGILSGALEDASLSLLTSKSSSNNTMSQSGASSSPENVTIHFSSTHQGKAAGNPWMQCVSWGVCVRLTQAAIASPAAWVTENLAISVLELEIGQFMTEELQVALRRAILLGRREEYCEPLKMGCSWENFTFIGYTTTTITASTTVIIALFNYRHCGILGSRSSKE